MPRLSQYTATNAPETLVSAALVLCMVSCNCLSSGTTNRSDEELLCLDTLPVLPDAVVNLRQLMSLRSNLLQPSVSMSLWPLTLLYGWSCLADSVSDAAQRAPSQPSVRQIIAVEQQLIHHGGQLQEQHHTDQPSTAAPRPSATAATSYVSGPGAGTPAAPAAQSAAAAPGGGPGGAGAVSAAAAYQQQHDRLVRQYQRRWAHAA